MIDRLWKKKYRHVEPLFLQQAFVIFLFFPQARRLASVVFEGQANLLVRKLLRSF